LTVKAHSNNHLEDDVIAFLAPQGFQVAVSEDAHLHRLLAVRNSCHMSVIIASNDGTDRDMTRSFVALDENLIFVYRGRVYQEQPTFLTVSAELSARALRKLGLTDRREFVLAVVAQRQCDADRLPWHEIRN
jgi:hypothetical protein